MVIVDCEGDRAEEALAALTALIADRFGEAE
jgi:phosphotransferase system HPr-like phosphotransfer protein